MSVSVFFILCCLLEMVCDPLGDQNVWASTRPLNNTAKGHKMWESVVIAAARVSLLEIFILFVYLSRK